MKFSIEGEPVGKARPRVYHTNGVTRAVTPEKTKEYERQAKIAYWGEYGHRMLYLTEPLSVEIIAEYNIPQSASKKKRAAMLAGEICPTKKPDIDNVVKSILDALNGVAYSDDKQVVRLTAVKRYAEAPKTTVLIKEVKGGKE